MALDKEHFERAVSNVALWGDTDVFPFPFDNHVMHDRNEDVTKILIDLSRDFNSRINSTQVDAHSTLAPVGYTGFRWATQIDPLWNAYLLGAVLSLAEKIEAARIPRDQETVFSYRYDPENDRVFSPSGWHEFQSRCRELANAHSLVITTDIADFYPRVYHHRLENALQRVDPADTATTQIRKILGQLSGAASYGLPVGGPAARLLSELTINQIDWLLSRDRAHFEFCRYADDFRIFVDDLPTAYRMIGLLSDRLQANHGLSLQKSKTSILTSEEYLALLEPEDPPEGSAAKFLSLHLHFDPYSETPVEDYEQLRDQVGQFDILDLLRTELLKGQVHISLTRKLVRALRFLDEESRHYALLSLLDQGNFERLAPVMPQVLIAIRDALQGLPDDAVKEVVQLVRDKVESDHYLARIELNLAFMVRILALDRSDETERLLIRLFDEPHGFRERPSPVIQRDIMMILARWGTTYWLSNQRTNFAVMHPWVRRAFIVASFALTDEGKYWRTTNRRRFSEYDGVVLTWAEEKSKSADWEIPL